MNNKFLYVEDDSEAVDLVRAVLKDVKIIRAPTGREALTCIDQGEFDLYLIDHYLPDTYGLDLCREIRGHDDFTPAVFITASHTLSIYDVREAGGQGLVKKASKTFIDQLRQTVTDLTALRRSGRMPASRNPSKLAKSKPMEWTIESSSALISVKIRNEFDLTAFRRMIQEVSEEMDDLAFRPVLFDDRELNLENVVSTDLLDIRSMIMLRSRAFQLKKIGILMDPADVPLGLEFKRLMEHTSTADIEIFTDAERAGEWLREVI